MYSRVYVEITNICNMNCSFCHGHLRAPRQMTAQEFSHVLDSLAGVTDYIYYHLMGEPLTHPELPSFIDMASKRGFKSMITTNGTLLSKRGNGLISAGVHKINISLHSFEGDDSLKHKQYLCDVADFAKRASEKGIIVVLRLWNNGFDGGKNSVVLDFMRDSITGEWSENNRGLRLRPKLFLEWGERFAWPDREAKAGGSELSCYGLRDHFGILCDGTVVPCCLDSDGVINLGNIFDTELSDILNAERARAIKRGFECRHATEQLCRRCGYARRF
jgi:radical SAM protein with 4Fe4S-binding SPASM domain